VDRRRVLRLSVHTAYTAVAAAAGGCATAKEAEQTPGLEPRGTTLTTVKPSRQDVLNKLSLTGKVTLSPVFGLVAPVAGQVRYLNVSAPQATPTRPTKVANVVASGKSHAVEVPAGSVFLGRLVDDRSTVTAGMPIVSAKFAGYGIVAEVDGAQAYRVADSLGSIQAQIQGGPGPFACTVLGTIAALPAGVVPPAPQQQQTQPQPQRNPGGNTGGGNTGGGSTSGGNASEATGLRLVCVPPAGVRMINGASATLEVVTAKASNVLVLPVEAVAGGQGRGQVDIVKPDGQRETREVELGLTDGKVIEIKSGLSGDETVAVPGPNLPTPSQEGKGNPRVPGMLK
jgi:hypothetical protein